MRFSDLAGKTIVSATKLKHEPFDDEAWVMLELSDGTHCIIQATYGSYTGKSEDEYPSYIGIIKTDGNVWNYFSKIEESEELPEEKSTNNHFVKALYIEHLCQLVLYDREGRTWSVTGIYPFSKAQEVLTEMGLQNIPVER